MAVKCGQSMIAGDCGDHSCEQGQAGGRFDCWSGSRGSWWVIECGKTKVITVSRLLIVRHTAEKKGMFYIHSSIVNSDVKFVHKVCFSHEFNKFKNHQQSDFIKKILNEDCFENFIVKVVMLDNNAQKLSIVFLKTVIFLLADLQFESNFHDWIQKVV